MAKKKYDIGDMKEGLQALVTPSASSNTPEPEKTEPAQAEKKRYKTCNYVTDVSHHTRLKKYAVENGITLLEAFNQAIDFFLDHKGGNFKG